MLHLISLGSSFAAGPGLQPITSIPAKRSAVNYPSLLATLLHVDSHTDLSYSGATLLNILNTPQDEAPPQIDATPAIKPSDRCIVTITAGGNDLGYVGGIMADSFAASWLGWPVAYMMSRRPAPLPLDEQGLLEWFKEVIRAVKAKIPNAEVILVGYLTLLGDDIAPGVNAPLTSEQVEKAKDKEVVLRRAYKRAAEEMGVGFVDAAEKSRGHGVGSEVPWVHGHTWATIWGGEMGWHPTKQGMKAVADMVYEYIQSQGKSSVVA